MNYGCGPVPQRVWQHVVPGALPDASDPLVRPTEGPCWEWKGSKTSKGYGKCWAYSERLGRMSLRQAHVCFWEWEHGEPLPSGAQTDHLCRNTGCVNPLHLEMVSPSENVRRGLVPQQQKALAAAGLHPLQRPGARVKAMAASLAAMPEEHRQAYQKRTEWRALPIKTRLRIQQERAAESMRSEEQRELRRGARNAACRMQEEDVRRVRASLVLGETEREIAARYGISASLVHAIKTGRKWGWLR